MESLIPVTEEPLKADHFDDEDDEFKLEEIYWLKREKKMLMEKIEKIKREEEEARAHLKALEKRIEGTEMRQEEMMGLLTKAIQDPALLMELVKDEEETMGSSSSSSVDQVDDITDQSRLLLANKE